MKKRILILALILFTGINAVLAQNDAVYSATEKKIAKADAAVADPKRESSSKAWLEKARAYKDAYNINLGLLRLNAPPEEIAIILKTEPTDILASSDGKEQHVYPNIVLYYQNGGLTGWEETKKITEDPIGTALESYKKVLSLSPTASDKERVNTELGSMKFSLEMEGLNAYGRGKYKDALINFERMMDVNVMLGKSMEADTNIVYYAGFMSLLSEEKEKALKYLTRAMELNVDQPAIYEFVYGIYMEKGDTITAVNTLTEGNKRYPEDKNILLQLIQSLIGADKSEEAIEKLEAAKSIDPSNKLYPYVEGTLYDKIGDTDKSAVSYEKAIELDPDFFDALFNVSVLYFNQAVVMSNAANDEEEIEAYNKKQAEADAIFQKALKPLEKCYELNPEDKYVLSTLKTLYYRLKMEDKYNEIDELLKK